MYRIVFTEEAQKDLQLLNKRVPQAIKKTKVIVSGIAVASSNRNWTNRTVEILCRRNLVEAYKQRTQIGVSHL